MAPFTEQMLAAGAAFTPAEGPPAFAAVGSDSRERERIDPAIECIGCGMCVSACTIVAHDPKFPGPAALTRIFTLEVDSRDAGGVGRVALLSAEDVLLRCHGQANCTEVCPMGISPTTSILALRRQAVARLFRWRAWQRNRRAVTRWGCGGGAAGAPTSTVDGR
jgi:succinate dehydrogenase/fumarate reductase-like Fe-S protein